MIGIIVAAARKDTSYSIITKILAKKGLKIAYDSGGIKMGQGYENHNIVLVKEDTVIGEKDYSGYVY